MMSLDADNMKNGGILLAAHDLINGERAGDYGAAAVSFNRIAAMWSAYLGKEISGHDVACMMTLLKLAREAHSHKADNLIDAAGYIGLAADMATCRKSKGAYIGLDRE